MPPKPPKRYVYNLGRARYVPYAIRDDYCGASGNVCQPAKFYKLRPNAAPELVAERKGGVTFAVDKDGNWLLSEVGNILTDRFGLLLAGGGGTITPSLNGREAIKLRNNLFLLAARMAKSIY